MRGPGDLHPRHLALVWICLTTLTGGLLSTRPLAAELPDSDDALESCLSQGKIGKNLGTLDGITLPQVYEIDCGDSTLRGVFKYVDEVRWGVTRFGSGRREVHFSDSYRYERAAYLLDRELGLRMVPVTVLRKVRGREGCLSHFLAHSSHEREPIQGLTGEQILALSKQKAIMRIFDALIYNTDRNLGNWLVDDADRSLYLIDHSRSFRDLDELPEELLERHVRLPRELYDRLAALGEERLMDLLDDLLTRSQIRAVLVRRDLILKSIDDNREVYGDAFVFTD